MPSPAILKIKKTPGILALPKAVQVRALPASVRSADDTATRRRELARLLRSIKTLVRQSS